MWVLHGTPLPCERRADYAAPSLSEFSEGNPAPRYRVSLWAVERRLRLTGESVHDSLKLATVAKMPAREVAAVEGCGV